MPIVDLTRTRTTQAIRELALWTWERTHEGEAISDEKIELMLETLLQKCDKHEDGCVHTELFLAYYEELAAAIVRHNTEVEETDKHLKRLLEFAKNKFVELDVDRSGYLKGEEVMVMAEWVWKTFHRGEVPTPAIRTEEAAKILKRCDVDEDPTLSLRNLITRTLTLTLTLI